MAQGGFDLSRLTGPPSTLSQGCPRPFGTGYCHNLLLVTEEAMASVIVIAQLQVRKTGLRLVRRMDVHSSTGSQQHRIAVKFEKVLLALGEGPDIDQAFRFDAHPLK